MFVLMLVRKQIRAKLGEKSPTFLNHFAMALLSPTSHVPPTRAYGLILAGLARKIVTLLASILIYGHKVNLMQFVGLAIAVGAMVFNFLDKGKKKGGQ